MRKTPTLLVLASVAALAACNTQPAEEPDAGEPTPTGTASATPDPDAPVSIIRPDIEQPELPEIPLEPLEVTIGFPEGGSELDAAATAALQLVLSSDEAALGLPITVRAHSDAGGSDAANLRASRARGERVRDWLVKNGIDEERIEVIAFGEQNPVQPNALPDGSPNEAGRAANRRVEIEVAVTEIETPVLPDESEPAD
ncbi:OmpA family protein [Erythrobacter sp. GH1-10]|uniref:OmpA family protein n=1 Tax=Erythrobacter sp. GH1-10 TaxID=3349334 RepID=UPI003877E39E